MVFFLNFLESGPSFKSQLPGNGSLELLSILILQSRKGIGSLGGLLITFNTVLMLSSFRSVFWSGYFIFKNVAYIVLCEELLLEDAMEVIFFILGP